MKVSAFSLLGVALLSTGCYNDPDITRRHPGQGPERIHAGPAVGPGTSAGGSTAGPYKPSRAHGEHGEEHTVPTHSGVRSSGSGTDGAAEPKLEHENAGSAPGRDHSGPTPRTGNRPASVPNQ